MANSTVDIKNCKEYKDAIEALLNYQKAALKFIKKVENNQARSKETYADLKECYKNTNELLYRNYHDGGE